MSAPRGSARQRAGEQNRPATPVAVRRRSRQTTGLSHPKMEGELLWRAPPEGRTRKGPWTRALRGLPQTGHDRAREPPAALARLLKGGNAGEQLVRDPGLRGTGSTESRTAVSGSTRTRPSVATRRPPALSSWETSVIVMGLAMVILLPLARSRDRAVRASNGRSGRLVTANSRIGVPRRGLGSETTGKVGGYVSPTRRKGEREAVRWLLAAPRHGTLGSRRRHTPRPVASALGGAG